MLYDRKIKYLDYYEGGERVKGAGFVKLEARGSMLRLELTVRGLHPTDSFDREVVLRDVENEAALGQIHIQNGSGSFHYEGELKEGIIAETGLSYEALAELRVLLGGTREIVCPLGKETARMVGVHKESVTAHQDDFLLGENAEILQREEQEETQKRTQIENSKENVKEVTKEAAREDVDEVEREIAGEAVQESAEEAGEEPAIGDRDETVATAVQTTGTGTKIQENQATANNRDLQALTAEQKLIRILEDDLRNTWKPSSYQPSEIGAEEKAQPAVEGAKKTSNISPSSDRGSGGTQKQPEAPKTLQREIRDKPPVRLMEDKWQQLSHVYPHIQPFRDERDYLSVSPSDFVLFPSGCYKLVNNSFMLHGYHNYHHLILARVERRGEVLYYLGVPGNYFDREKQVALMFGFESFECENEPAKTGDFGYYMMRTEL